MNRPIFYESTLRIGDNVFHERCKTRGHHFGNELGNGMNEANGSKIRDIFRTGLLWEQDNVRGVEPLKVSGEGFGIDEPPR